MDAFRAIASVAKAADRDPDAAVIHEVKFVAGCVYGMPITLSDDGSQG